MGGNLFLPYRMKYFSSFVRWQSSSKVGVALTSDPYANLLKVVSKDDSETIYCLTFEDIQLITKNCPMLKERLDLLLLELYVRETQGLEIPKLTGLNTLKKTIAFPRKGTYGLSDFFIRECERNVFTKDDVDIPPYLAYPFPLVGYISKSERNRLFAYTGYQGMQFGQNMVLDFSSLKSMTPPFKRTVGNKIRHLTMLNGMSRRPFNLYFCRFFENRTVFALEGYLRHIVEKCAVTATAKCYSEMFSRDRIVYISPYATNEIEYNPDDVYVISPAYDPNIHLASYSKIKNLRMATLPFGLKWQHGGMWHSVDEVYQLLSAWKNFGCQRQQNLRYVKKR